jgi:hypothetical protein
MNNVNKIQVMKSSIYRLAIVLILALAITLLVNSCKKVEAVIEAQQQTICRLHFHTIQINLLQRAPNSHKEFHYL